jgi:hypothetical protein
LAATSPALVKFAQAELLGAGFAVIMPKRIEFTELGDWQSAPGEGAIGEDQGEGQGVQEGTGASDGGGGQGDGDGGQSDASELSFFDDDGAGSSEGALCSDEQDQRDTDARSAADAARLAERAASSSAKGPARQPGRKLSFVNQRALDLSRAAICAVLAMTCNGYLFDTATQKKRRCDGWCLGNFTPMSVFAARNARYSADDLATFAHAKYAAAQVEGPDANVEFQFIVNGVQICEFAFIQHHALKNDTAEKAKARVKKRLGPQHQQKRGRRSGGRSHAALQLVEWLRAYIYSGFVDFMPDSAGASGSHEGGQYHVPSWLSWEDLHEQYTSEMKERSEPSLGMSQFNLLRQSEFPLLVRPRTKRFGMCSTCASLQTELQRCKDVPQREEVKRRLKWHNETQMGERAMYYLAREFGFSKSTREFDGQTGSWLVIIIDGMDQSKGTLPNLKLAKCTDGVFEVKFIGVKVHGGPLFILAVPKVLIRGDSDLNITVLSLVLQYLTDLLGEGMPSNLWVQLDSASDNNCTNMHVYLCLLALSGKFAVVRMARLIPHHTHEDIDQIFSVISM